MLPKLEGGIHFFGAYDRRTDQHTNQKQTIFILFKIGENSIQWIMLGMSFKYVQKLHKKSLRTHDIYLCLLWHTLYFPSDLQFPTWRTLLKWTRLHLNLVSDLRNLRKIRHWWHTARSEAVRAKPDKPSRTWALAMSRSTLGHSTIGWPKAVMFENNQNWK